MLISLNSPHLLVRAKPAGLVRMIWMMPRERRASLPLRMRGRAERRTSIFGPRVPIHEPRTVVATASTPDGRRVDGCG